MFNINLLSLISILALTLIFSWAMTGILWKLCLAFQIVDQPNERSLHNVPKAVMGGVAIVSAFVIGLMLSVVRFGTVIPFFHMHKLKLAVLLGCALLISVVGFIDDIKKLSVQIRFPIHIAIAVLSVRIIFQLAHHPLSLINGFFLVLAVIWIIGNLNVYNFMDGADSMAAGCGGLFSLFFFILGILKGLPIVALLALLLAMAQFGFLFWNWPPAKIFMGDVGSTFLGYMFALIALLLSIHQPANIIFSVIILLPFLFDGGVIIIRRMIHHEPLFAAHRKHLYQRLIRSGWPHVLVSALYFLLTTGCGITSVLFAFANVAPWMAWSFIAAYGLLYIAIEKRFVKVPFNEMIDHIEVPPKKLVAK